MKKRLAGAVLASFLAISSAMAGCGGGTPVLKAYQVDYTTNLSGVGKEAGDMVEPFASNLVVVGDESGYQDDAISAEAAVIYNISDQQPIFSKNAFERLHPASITKVMTALIALRYGNLQDSVTVTYDMIESLEGTSSTVADLQDGETYTIEQLLYGLMLPSGNDAALVIANHIGQGSVDAFVEMMNQEAQRIGATGTHFTNPHGLTDEEHYTTAYDVYLIMNQAVLYDKFLEIIGSASYDAVYTDEDGTQQTRTWNSSIAYNSGEIAPPENVTVLGGKTGTTSKAMRCLTTLAQDENGKRYISVILKADTRELLYYQTNLLYDKIHNQ